MRIGLVAIAISLWTGAVALQADVVWDEQVDGDLRPETDPTPLVMTVGASDILGTVGGDPNNPLQDAYDAFVMQVGAGESWSGFTLVDHDPNPPNQTTGIVIYEGSNSLTGIFLNGIPAAGMNVDLFALMALGPLGPGTYTVGIRDFESFGNFYHLQVQLVPEPGGVSLVLLAMLTVAWRRRGIAPARLMPVASC